jgi:hypothetical protein
VRGQLRKRPPYLRNQSRRVATVVVENVDFVKKLSQHSWYTGYGAVFVLSKLIHNLSTYTGKLGKEGRTLMVRLTKPQ